MQFDRSVDESLLVILKEHKSPCDKEHWEGGMQDRVRSMYTRPKIIKLCNFSKEVWWLVSCTLDLGREVVKTCSGSWRGLDVRNVPGQG